MCGLIQINSKKLNKQTDEMELQYIWRVGQLYDSGLIVKDDGLTKVDWNDLCKLFNKQLNRKWTEAAYRKPYQNSVKYFNVVFKDMIESEDFINDLESKQRELKKEQYKFYDQRNAYNKVLRDRSRQEELNDIITQTVNSGNLPVLNYIPNTNNDYQDNSLLVSLNDLHIGADVKNAFNVYNSDICRERLCEYLDKVKSISSLHKSRECVVWCNGDIISGNIHKTIAITNKENVIEQIMTASELISGFIYELSKLFDKVRFASVAGNHSRLDTKDDSLKDERLDDLVEWYLKARLQNFDNVKFGEYDKIDSTMYLIDIQGFNFVGSHGDYDNSVTKIQALQMMIKKDIYGILLGHRHHNKTDCVQGIKTVMAGSFLGVDDYCISKRIYGKPEQLISVIDTAGSLCHYDVQFTK